MVHAKFASSTSLRHRGRNSLYLNGRTADHEFLTYCKPQVQVNFAMAVVDPDYRDAF